MQVFTDINLWQEAEESGCPSIRWHPKHKRWIVLDRDPCPGCISQRCDNRGKPWEESNKTFIVKTRPDDKSALVSK